MAYLLIVDDEPTICWGLTKLAQRLGHRVATAGTAEQALELVSPDRPDAVLLDVRLPGMDGLQAMTQLHRRLGSVPVVIMTAYGDLGTAVEAVRNGAFEYLVKPFDLELAERVIRRALEVPEPAIGTLPATQEVGPSTAPLEGQLVGRSPAMQEVFKRIALVAPTTACVHLCGESGTGKELVARAMHRYSQRSGGPFVAVNLAALSPTLAESELFGHVAGAFTGAEGTRRGLLEQADGGTIFLDEVADIPLALQVKLLRALEHGEVLPVGAERPIFADFRVVSATHQNLTDQVANGTFRHDLFFRLSTFQIEIPPLRKRPEDISDLAEHFLGVLSRKNNSPRPQLTPEALAELRGRPWHGNVRELRNAIEHALILSRGSSITADHLPPPVPGSAPRTVAEGENLADLLKQWANTQLDAGEINDLYERLLLVVEPPVLEVALQRHNHQVATAARSLGLHRITLKKKVDQYELGDR